MENNEKRKGNEESSTTDDEESEENTKIDKFYSLLRSFRDARDRRRKELKEQEINNNKKRKMTTTEPESNWVPCFEWGDFSTDFEFRIRPHNSSTSTAITSPTPCDNHKGNNNNNNNKKKDQQQDNDDDRALDLNLAL